MRIAFPFYPALIAVLLISIGGSLSGQVRDVDYSKRDTRFSEKMFPTEGFSTPVRNPENLSSRFSFGRDSEQGLHRFQRAAHPEAQRQVFENSRFSGTDQRHRSDGRVHRQFAEQGSSIRFQGSGSQRFSPSEDQSFPMLEIDRLQRIRENTLNQRFQSVVDRSLELSAENPEGGISVEWERGIPYPRPRIASERMTRERDFSLEDINRFQFRSSRSSTPGIPVQEAGAGINR